VAIGLIDPRDHRAHAPSDRRRFDTWPALVDVDVDVDVFSL
jgi:hypothetical protein